MKKSSATLNTTYRREAKHPWRRAEKILQFSKLRSFFSHQDGQKLLRQQLWQNRKKVGQVVMMQPSAHENAFFCWFLNRKIPCLINWD